MEVFMKIVILDGYTENPGYLELGGIRETRGVDSL
jgi:hypothetical protein